MKYAAQGCIYFESYLDTGNYSGSGTDIDFEDYIGTDIGSGFGHRIGSDNCTGSDIDSARNFRKNHRLCGPSVSPLSDPLSQSPLFQFLRKSNT